MAAPVPSKQRRYIEIEASARSAKHKRQAGEQLTAEEEAIVRETESLGAALQAEQERRASRAGGLGWQLGLSGQGRGSWRPPCCHD